MWEVDDKRGRSERKGILEGGLVKQIACKTLAKHHGGDGNGKMLTCYDS